MAPAFFGLTPNDTEIYLEPIFYLVYYLGMTYVEAYNMPIWRRNWFLERVVAEIKKTNQSKATPEQARGMAGKLRPQGPQRTKRFT